MVSARRECYVCASLTDVFEADGHAVQRPPQLLRVPHVVVQSLSLFARVFEEHWMKAGRGNASRYQSACSARCTAGATQPQYPPSVRQLVASWAWAARAMYASSTSDAVHSPAPMRWTISDAGSREGHEADAKGGNEGQHTLSLLLRSARVARRAGGLTRSVEEHGLRGHLGAGLAQSGGALRLLFRRDALPVR